jgi:hypothetical protein
MRILIVLDVPDKVLVAKYAEFSGAAGVKKMSDKTICLFALKGQLKLTIFAGLMTLPTVGDRILHTGVLEVSIVIN